MNNKRTIKRYRRERLFIIMSILSIITACSFLLVLISTLIGQGWGTLTTASIKTPIYIDASVIGNNGEKSALRYNRLIKNALTQRFPNVTKRSEKKALVKLFSFSAAVNLREDIIANQNLIGQTVTVQLQASSIASRYLKGDINTDIPETQRNISNQQIQWLNHLREIGDTQLSFNTQFFIGTDSRDAESAGILTALIGSFYSLLLAFLFSFPLAVIAAIYLELFAPKNRFLDFIEININNLAAVPSIIFGLLGLVVFINFFQLPRSSPLVGGLVLALMTLPTIIIATRSAIKSVPPSYLSGALSIGATKMQGVFHHVLPSAMPGILTGTIIGMAGALGETAPLLMIGMVAFITDAPASITDAATTLPIQIFLWADSPERGYVERTATAILVLLIFLVVMNITAIIMRKRMETNAQ